MKYRNAYKLFCGLFCLIVLSSVLWLPGAAAAAGNAVVSVSAPAADIEPGQQFTIAIDVVPNNEIAGMQFNLAFNPTIATAVSVAEGDLLNQGGASSYFSSGNINNQAGTITGVFGAIINPGQSVAAAGTFAVITMTAGAGGTSPLTLSKVIVGNVASQSVPTSVVSGAVYVAQSGGAIPPVGGGGGGGGGAAGGGGGVAAGITSLRASTSADGRTFEEVTASDIEMQVQLVIKSGTLVRNSLGQPATSIRIMPLGDTVDVDPGSTAISQSFDIEQSGTTFQGPATLIFRYYSLTLPAGIPESNFYIALKDPSTGSWTDLGGTVDTIARTVSVPIQHLSTYALMAHTRPVSFEISKLILTPTEIDLGGTVTASATVNNQGDLPGTCKVTLTLDNNQFPIKEVVLNGGDEATVSFLLTPDAVGEHQVTLGDMEATFRVKIPPAPAAFTLEEINISPLQASLGDSVTISAIVKNTGDQAGSYNAVLTVDDIDVGSSGVLINGGESQTVTFNFVADTAGVHTVSIGGMVASFEVNAPPAPPAPAAAPAATRIELMGFNTTPTYNEATDQIVAARIAFKADQDWSAFPDARLMLTVFHNDQFLEQVPLLELSERQPDGKSGEFSYTPAAGWETGEYAFRAELYRGETLVQDTPLEKLTEMAGSTAVVSWKILGIIIGAALGVGTIVVTLVLYFRRDMMSDYWK